MFVQKKCVLKEAMNSKIYQIFELKAAFYMYMI